MSVRPDHARTPPALCPHDVIVLYGITATAFSESFCSDTDFSAMVFGANTIYRRCDTVPLASFKSLGKDGILV